LSYFLAYFLYFPHIYHHFATSQLHNLWCQVTSIDLEQACKQIATLGLLLSLLLSLLIIIDDGSGQTCLRYQDSRCSLTGSLAKPLQPTSPQLVPGAIGFMFLLKFLTLGPPVCLWMVGWFSHSSCLLSCIHARIWKIPEYLMEHLEHAIAQQWNLLKVFFILPQPANTTY
jgi:hypothetical protein